MAGILGDPTARGSGNYSGFMANSLSGARKVSDVYGPGTSFGNTGAQELAQSAPAAGSYGGGGGGGGGFGSVGRSSGGGAGLRIGGTAKPAQSAAQSALTALLQGPQGQQQNLQQDIGLYRQNMLRQLAGEAAPAQPRVESVAETDPNLKAWYTAATARVNDPNRLPAEDPRLADYWNRVKGRLDNPMQGVGRAVDIAGGKLRDLTEGQRKALSGQQAARGVLSRSSIPGMTDAALARGEQRSIAGAAADITEAARAKEDAFLLGAGAAAGAPGTAQRQQQALNDAALTSGLGAAAGASAVNSIANRQLGLNAWEAAQADERARQQLQLQNWKGQVDLITSLLRI